MKKSLRRIYVSVVVVFLLNVCSIRLIFAENIIHVGVLNIAPYAFQVQGVHQGMAVDLWSRIAAKNGWKFKYVLIDGDIEKLLSGLQDSTLDVVIGGVSVTYERMKVADFSTPYFINRIGVVGLNTSKTFSQMLWVIAANLVDYKFHVLIGLLVFFIFINLLWWFEYGKIKDKKYKSGINDLAWNAFLIFMTKQQVGLYKTWFGRILVAILICASLVVSGLIIAAFSSALTLSLSSKSLNVERADLESRPVAAIKGSFEATLAKELGFQYRFYPNLSQSMDALLEGEVVGVMIDIPTAHYYLKAHNHSNLKIMPFTLNYNEFAFAFKRNSPYLRKFNLSLTELQDRREAKNICEIYIGPQEADLCNL